MSERKNYMIFVWLVLLIAIAVGGIYSYNEIVKKPFDIMRQQNSTISELEKNITVLQDIIDKNQTIIETKTVEMKKASWVTVVAIIAALIFFILWLSMMMKGRGNLKLRHEIIPLMRKYAWEKDGVKVHKQIFYTEGFYKADMELAYYAVLFCTSFSWSRKMFEEQKNAGDFKGYSMHIEPPKEFIYGYMGDRRNPEDCKDIQGMSIADVEKHIKNMEWGLEPPHFKPYKTKSYEQKALQGLEEYTQAVQKDAQYKKDVEKAMED